MIIVPGYGSTPCDYMLIGEAPGETEAEKGRPFCGKSGDEQNWYLARYWLHSSKFYLSNVVKQFTPGNPDPTPSQVAYWTPHLEREISRCQPKLIVAAGRFAARWFLGDSADLEDCHGMPHRGGEFDSSISNRSQGAIVLPIYHPAYGFYSPEMKSIINWDYGQVAHHYNLVKTGRADLVLYRYDPYAGSECYLDVTGEELADLISSERPEIVGYDTENEWSFQVSTAPGTGYVLRRCQPDFKIGVKRFQELTNSGCLVCIHNAGSPQGCMHDVIMSRRFHDIELTNADLWDTMEAAYELRLESKSLKSLAWRWLGMRMEDYNSVILGDVARDKQVEYLSQVLTRQWPKPATRQVWHNDGTVTDYTPQSIPVFARAIVRDTQSGKVNKDGEPTNPYTRWMGGESNKGIAKDLRLIVERELGSIPTATLDDIPLDRAVFYAGRDSDATLRLKTVLEAQLESQDLLPLFHSRMKVLPIFEEMQRVGMDASRSAFVSLSESVRSEMVDIQAEISTEYFGGRPFNPGSSEQTRELLRRRGLKGEKRTKTGQTSTAKKSIEHLRYKDPAIARVFDWRERAKVKSTYSDPIIEIANEQLIDKPDEDHFIVNCIFKPVTTTSLRLSSEKPSLLNQPIRTKLGRQVRACYRTVNDYVYAAFDFSGQEARVAAHFCNSPLMIKLFSTCRYCGMALSQSDINYGTCPKSPFGRHKGGDIHSNTAHRVFGVPPDQQDTFKHRIPAKTGFFGILNGMQGPGLLDQFRMYVLPEYDPDGYWSKLDNCSRLVDEIKKKVYPELHQTATEVERQIARTGEIRSLFGMPRYLPAGWSNDLKERAEAGRQAFNHVIQCTAQSMTQNSMVWIDPYIKDMRSEGLEIWWALQIHDELLSKMTKDLYEVVEPIFVEGMTYHCGIDLKVPIEVEAHCATSWGDLK